MGACASRSQSGPPFSRELAIEQQPDDFDGSAARLLGRIGNVDLAGAGDLGGQGAVEQAGKEGVQVLGRKLVGGARPADAGTIRPARYRIFRCTRGALRYSPAFRRRAPGAHRSPDYWLHSLAIFRAPEGNSGLGMAVFTEPPSPAPRGCVAVRRLAL